MDLPPDASNSTAPCPLLLSTWLLDAAGNLLGETLMLQALGSVGSPGSSCSAQQCSCPVAGVPRVRGIKGTAQPKCKQLSWLLLLGIRMALRVIWPMEQASWPFFPECTAFKSPLVVHYKALAPMQTDHRKIYRSQVGLRVSRVTKDRNENLVAGFWNCTNCLEKRDSDFFYCPEQDYPSSQQCKPRADAGIQNSAPAESRSRSPAGKMLELPALFSFSGFCCSCQYLQLCWKVILKGQR